MEYKTNQNLSRNNLQSVIGSLRANKKRTNAAAVTFKAHAPFPKEIPARAIKKLRPESEYIVVLVAAVRFEPTTVRV